jgi:hypothetical protein
MLLAKYKKSSLRVNNIGKLGLYWKNPNLTGKQTRAHAFK